MRRGEKAYASLMIILKVYIGCIFAIHTPRNSPIAGHSNAVFIFSISSQSMKIQSGDVHIVCFFNHIQSVQNNNQTLRNLRVNPTLVGIARVAEETLQSFVAKLFNHKSSVINMITLGKSG